MTQEERNEIIRSKMEEALYNLLEELRPYLTTVEDQKCLHENMERLSGWISVMPLTMHKDKHWSREEFQAALTGPNPMSDPRFGAYMDAFYEEYMGNKEDALHAFYDELFHEEEELNRVDWQNVWEMVRASYEDWLKANEYEDEWLKGAPSAQ